mgnify:CR=1 FL=1
MNRWLRFGATRLLGLFGVLLMMVLVLFALRQIIPIDPARSAVGPNAPEEVVIAKRIEMHLNESVSSQFLNYLSDITRADFGTSIVTKNSVSKDITKTIKPSLELMLFSVFLSVVFGFAVAIIQAIAQSARVFRWVLLIFSAVPNYLLALIGLYFLWFKFGLLPSGGRSSLEVISKGPTGFLSIDYLIKFNFGGLLDALQHLILPSIVLGMPMTIAISRSLQSSLFSVLRSNYVRTAKSKGLTPRQILFAHSLRNSMNSPLAMFGLYFGLMLTNLLIVEQIFAWPGIGAYAVRAIAASDLTAILGVSMVFGVLYILVNTAVEIAQVYFDPRIRPN